jgi:hypothetical protein
LQEANGGLAAIGPGLTSLGVNGPGEIFRTVERQFGPSANSDLPPKRKLKKFVAIQPAGFRHENWREKRNAVKAAKKVTRPNHPPVKLLKDFEGETPHWESPKSAKKNP